MVEFKLLPIMLTTVVTMLMSNMRAWQLLILCPSHFTHLLLLTSLIHPLLLTSPIQPLTNPFQLLPLTSPLNSLTQLHCQSNQ